MCALPGGRCGRPQVVVAQIGGEAGELARREGLSHARGVELDDLAAVVARHGEHEIGGAHVHRGEVAGAVGRHERRVDAAGDGEVSGFGSHRHPVARASAGAGDAHRKIGEAGGQQLRGQGGAADVAGAHGEDLEHGDFRCR